MLYLVPQLKVPKTKFILPTANSIPINLNGNHRMPGWSDIYGLSPDSPEDKPGLEKSRERIDSIVAKELIAGISPSRIILAGFSQGGALALHTVSIMALTLPIVCIILTCYAFPGFEIFIFFGRLYRAQHMASAAVGVSCCSISYCCITARFPGSRQRGFRSSLSMGTLHSRVP